MNTSEDKTAAETSKGWRTRSSGISQGRESSLRPYKRLAMELYFELGGADHGLCLMLTSPTPTAPTTRITIELAEFLATGQGYHVLVIDAAGNLSELETYFCGRSQAPSAGIQPTANSHILLAPITCLEKGRRSLFSSEHLRGQLESLTRDYDFVLINSSSFLSEPSLLAFPSAVDCVLLLGVAGATTRREIIASRRALTGCKARKLGLIFVHPDKGK